MVVITSPESIRGAESPAMPASRLRFAYENLGFLPSSTPELTNALKMEDLSSRRGGVAHYLNRILLAQARMDRGVVPDPAAGIRAVTHSFIDYYASAAEGYSQLMELTERFHRIGRPTDERSEDKIISESPETLNLLRFIALRDYCDSEPGTKNPLRARSANQYASIARLTEVTVGGLGSNELLYDASTDQYNRFCFWEQQLLSARAHAAARPIAEEALRTHGNALG